MVLHAILWSLLLTCVCSPLRFLDHVIMLAVSTRWCFLFFLFLTITSKPHLNSGRLRTRPQGPGCFFFFLQLTPNFLFYFLDFNSPVWRFFFFSFFGYHLLSSSFIFLFLFHAIWHTLRFLFFSFCIFACCVFFLYVHNSMRFSESNCMKYRTKVINSNTYRSFSCYTS